MKIQHEQINQRLWWTTKRTKQIPFIKNHRTKQKAWNHPKTTKTKKNIEHQPKVILPHILIYNTLRAFKGRINAADIHSSFYIDCKRPRQNHRLFQGVPNLASDEVITTFYNGVVEDLIAAWDALPGKNFLYFIGSLQAIIVFLLISISN